MHLSKLKLISLFKLKLECGKLKPKANVETKRTIPHKLMNFPYSAIAFCMDLTLISLLTFLFPENLETASRSSNGTVAKVTHGNKRRAYT